MKKIIYLLAFIVITITGCNPVEDINNDITRSDVAGEDEFTMTSDDYEAIVDQDEDADPDYYETFEAFSDLDDAKAMLPDFIADRYPFWGEESSVIVNFNLYDGNPVDANAFANADVYQLTTEDYPIASANAFYPNEDSSDFLEGILDAQITNPIEGQIVRAEFDQFTEEPVVGLASIVEFDFADSFEGWTTQEEFGGNDVWTSELEYVQGNGFFSGQVANIEWLVSPVIDLTAESDLRLQINQAIRFATDITLLKILVATDYSGDVATASWTEINLATAPAGDSDTLVLSEDFDFSDYDGQTINVAFKYESTDSDAARWRIASLALKTIGISGNTITESVYYEYVGGSWDVLDDVYYLTSGDYDSMGEESGQPGRFNNFSSSIATSDYLPQFLALEFPFAQEEDEIFIVYRFFRGGAEGTTTRGNLYTFINGEWIQSTTSLKLGFKNGVWVPDNTIRYTLTGDDYSLVVTELTGVAGFESAVENLDSFGNFNRTGPWTDDMVVTALNFVLDDIDPIAEQDQKYVVTIATWAPGNSTEDFALIKDAGAWRIQTDDD
jgi:hypothetical protein